MDKKYIVLIGILVILSGCVADEKPSPQKRPQIVTLKSPAIDSCGEPFLYTDKNGSVYMSWIEKNNDNYTLKFSMIKNDSSSTPVTIASGRNWFVNWADYPVICSGGNDDMFACYLEKSDSGAYTYDIKYVTSLNGGRSWTNPKFLNEDGRKAEHGFVSVLPYKNRYFVSWLDGRNTVDGDSSSHHAHHGQMTLRGAFITTDGQKQDECELDNRVCDCCQTTVAITAAGPVVVYRDRSEDETRDMGIVRLTSSGWTKPVIIHADKWKIEGCPVNGPRAEAIGNNLGVAWFTAAHDSGSVKAAFSDDGGGTFMPPVQVNDLSATGRVDLVMLDPHTAMVSWMEGSVIKARKIKSDGSADASFVVAESSAARSSGFPQMTKAGKQLYFAWTDSKTKSVRLASLVIEE